MKVKRIQKEKPMNEMLPKALNQVPQKETDDMQLTGFDKENLIRCILRYIDSDEFNDLIDPNQKIYDFVLIAVKLKLGRDFIDELKYKILKP